VSIIIVLTILSELRIPLYDKTLKPYLFTTHMLGWKGFFYIASNADGQTIRGSISNLAAVLKSLYILIAYIIIFTGSAIFIFNRKDILT
jgi:ABC-2 type transport system permease protein